MRSTTACTVLSIWNWYGSPRATIVSGKPWAENRTRNGAVAVWRASARLRCTMAAVAAT